MKVFLILLAVVLFCKAQSNNPKTREADPVVLTGEDIPEMLHIIPGDIIGYKFDGISLVQVPIQIDEMHVQLWNNIKDNDCFTQGRNHSSLVYADINTYSGGDDDRSFDENDELAFMAKDLGVKCDSRCSELSSGLIPPGLLPTPAEIEVFDPWQNRIHGYLYLYIQYSGDYDQDAGKDYVHYNFYLNKTGEKGTHDYFDAYNLHCSVPDGRYECQDPYPLNPEDSRFNSSFYERHWAQNWHGDEMKIFAGNATGEDMLAIQEFQFFLNDCGRCTESFMDGQTAFIANIDGPVRAIRSWVGANSACITQRQHIMY